MPKDFYELLGVPRNADEAQLKQAYRKLAMQYHPDRNPGNKDAEAKFKEINQAYEVLKDPQKRSVYDQFGHAGLNQGGGGGGGPGGFSADGSQFSGFGDIFEEFFGDIFGNSRGGGGGRGNRFGPMRGDDLRYDLGVTLEEVMEGTEKRVRFPTIIGCETCRGTGAKAGSGPEVCSMCSGSGQMRTQQGFFAISRPCPTCRGQGQIIRDPCNDCHGQGRVRKERTITVKVPPGVDSGNRIRLTGEGGAGLFGGPPGDLYIGIEVEAHPFFQREGPNLLCQVPVTFPQAALGEKLDVPTLNGKARVNLPAGCQTGKHLVLRGKGLPHLNRPGVYGDLVVEVRVETPVNLNRRQRELLEEFMRVSETDSQPESTSFLDKVKEFFDKKISS
ncbi:MAG: molecular chaperone DnaJ [Magnetococcales bacterium]|nr:molecular chaperone DnaJ [Magnetococcales bacterium]